MLRHVAEAGTFEGDLRGIQGFEGMSGARWSPIFKTGQVVETVEKEIYLGEFHLHDARPTIPLDDAVRSLHSWLAHRSDMVVDAEPDPAPREDP